ncbi:MAG TPA: glycosyltransferase family 9 protein [Paraburkholderia sp.]|jgi:lipopolysaccharide heptosyltransferase II|nr:glycosyltransferase family 9 protein [Paraburkholderia sp.]
MSDLAVIAPPTSAHARVAAAPPLAAWGADIKRILCVRTDNLGDVLMTTPAFRALRHATPQRHLTLLTSAAGSALAPLLPDIDEVIRYDAPWAGQAAQPSAAADLAMREWLSRRRFDAAVIFTVYSQNPLGAATMCHLAGIPRRLARCRENPYALLTDWLPEREPECGTQHEVQRQLSLVEAIGAHTGDTQMRLALRPEDRGALDAVLAARGIPAAQPFIVLHPGASAASRRYPAERFAAAAARLAGATGMPVLVTGSAGEAPLVREVCLSAGLARHHALHDLAGALELGAMAALIERARVLISNNSGPVHLASALGTPVVDLYALTNPQHAPWQTPHRVLFHDVDCRWCYRSVCPHGHHACLTGISASDVVLATLDLLHETRGRGAHAARLVDAQPPAPGSSLHF